MKITSGAYKGHTLETLEGLSVRPTADKVRQAVFNMLNSRIYIAGAHALDLFCGTGALGLEALSRGASHCTFIDISQESIDLCRRNAARLGVAPEHFQALKSDALQPPPPPEDHKVSLVFIDPPYGKNLVVSAVKAVKEGNWLADEYWMVIEIGARDSYPGIDARLRADKIYGQTRILIYSGAR